VCAVVIIDTEFNSAAQVPTRICVDAAQLAEERGFGCVWKGESNSRDPMVLLAAYAAMTSRIEIGTAIYHMYGRSPVTLGIQAATLNEYADGRLILGLGVANPTIAAWHGDVYDKPLRRIASTSRSSAPCTPASASSTPARSTRAREASSSPSSRPPTRCGSGWRRSARRWRS
jgi:Coenzyme F420-dependent N5,N10-methylene tetrahydromethanopterin reductase and related flavin-dependent oxidoreductases